MSAHAKATVGAIVLLTVIDLLHLNPFQSNVMLHGRVSVHKYTDRDVGHCFKACIALLKQYSRSHPASYRRVFVWRPALGLRLIYFGKYQNRNSPLNCVQ
jgi:hypothetical protein